MDESILLVYPEEVLEGRIPSRDFFTVYGLGNYLLLAGVYTISEPSLLAERLVGLSYQVAIVAALVRLCSRHGLVAAMSAALIGVLIFSGPFLLALSWLGGLAIFLWSLSLLQSSGARWCLISAGVLAGLVPFWRLEMAILLVAAIPLIRSLAQFRSFATGLAIGLVPVGAHLLVAGGAIWENVFLNRMGIDAQRDPSLLAPTVVAAACILVCSVAYLIWRSRLSRPDASTGITVLLLLPQAFQRTDYVHVVLMTGSVIVPLAVAPLMARVNVREARLAVAGLCAAATALTSLLVMQAVSTPDGIRLSRGDHSLHVASGSELVLRRTIRSVTDEVPAGSRLFVGSTDMSRPTGTAILLYHLLPEYDDDFYYMELPPGVAERRGSPLVADIMSADALLLTAPPHRFQLEYPNLGPASRAANRAVRLHFCPRREFGDVTLLMACN